MSNNKVPRQSEYYPDDEDGEYDGEEDEYIDSDYDY